MGQSRERTHIQNLFAGIEFAAPGALSTSTSAPIEPGGLAVSGCSFVLGGDLTRASLRAGVAAIVAAVHKANREQLLLARKDLKWRARGDSNSRPSGS